MNAAVTFQKRVIAQELLMMLASFLAFALLAPLLLRLDAVAATLWRVAGLAVLSLVATGATSWLRMRRLRFTLRTLAMGSTAVEPYEIEELRLLPSRSVAAHLGVAAVASLALPLLRPLEIGGEVARELGVLSMMSALATSIPAYVLAQARVARLLETAPLEVVTAQLETVLERDLPGRTSRRDLVFAVVVPVALVGVSGALASYAHLRAITEKERFATAVTMGRGVVGAGETKRSAGQKAAIEAARKLGYDVTLAEDGVDATGAVTRTADDRLSASFPLSAGSVTVRYASGIGWSASLPLFSVAFAFALLSTAAALAIARALSRDLTGAAERLRTLGTEAVLSGEQESASFPARFHVVADLFGAALDLAKRFRVFAAAQERALEAKENARRARGLLFASVSHDLKSPLNAILGFADSIDRAELSGSQRESLDLISTRGRELVALIETILDAARIEAGQLSLDRRKLGVAAWLSTAARLARELSLELGDLRVEIADELPDTEVDPVYLPRALAVVIAHALRAPTLDGGAAVITVRASLAEGGEKVRIEIDHGATSITAAELTALFARQSSQHGRGLSLGLSIARTIFERHGGSIEVGGDPRGAPVVLAFVPARIG